VKNSDDIFEAAIRAQVELAIEEADVIIFIVDVITGITDLDAQMADILRKNKKPIALAVNKVDNAQRYLEANEFWALGFESTFFISSISGSGTGELLDFVAEKIEVIEEEELNIPKFAVLGQPNAGKSSFINALLGEERTIVTDIAGTTRDSIHTHYNKFGKEFLLIDTAGIRKKARVHEDLEFYSVMRAIKALEEADICFLLLDATMGIEAQDMSIFTLARKRNKGIVILVNKWDLIEKETNTARDVEAKIKEKIAPFSDVPIVFVSVLEKQRIFKAIEAGLEVYENRTRRIPTSKLNDVMQEVIEAFHPPAYRGKMISIKYVTQLPGNYPIFAFFTNHPEHIKEGYKNYLENQLRKHFSLAGTPISIIFKEK
jgi:GTP-binding protein